MQISAPSKEKYRL